MKYPFRPSRFGFISFVLGAQVLLGGASLHAVMADEVIAEKKIAEKQLSLQETMQYAYLYNPTLKASRSGLRAVEEQLPQAFAGWQPTILSEAGLTASEVEGSNFGGGDGSTSKDLSVSLDQPLFKGGKTFAEVAAARYTIKSQQAVLASREQDILLEAVTAYVDVLRDEALLKLSQNTRDVIARELEATNDRFEVGELTRTDVSQAKARLARADSDVITARGTLNSIKAVFEEVIGIVPQGLMQQSVHFPIDVPASLDEAISLAEQSSPDVLVAVNAHKASEKDISGVFGELLPSVGISGSWARSYDPSPGLIDEQTSKSIGITASIPLYQAGSVRSRVRQAKHTANQRYLEILESKREVRQDVVSEWANLQTARAEIRSREAQIEASRVAQEGVRAEIELGSRTVLDVLDADQELLDAEVAHVIASRNEIVAKFTLLATLGSLLPETLGFTDDLADSTQSMAALKTNFLNMDVDRVQ